MKQFLRNLPVKLTITELAKKSADLAAALRDLAAAKEDAGATKRGLADGIKRREETIARLAQHVHEKAEPREVDCHEELDLGSAIARVYRDDTGELVDSRPMTEAEIRSERQAELPNISPDRRVGKALDVIRDPDGTGTTTVTHGFAGEPQQHIGGPKPRKPSKGA